MKPRVLIIISSDPRVSGRAAEAIRIAAGVGAWERIEITVYLRGEAVRMLCERSVDLVEGENILQYLPMLREGGQTVYTQKEAPALGSAEESLVDFTAIDDEQLADLAAKQTCVMRF